MKERAAGTSGESDRKHSKTADDATASAGEETGGIPVSPALDDQVERFVQEYAGSERGCREILERIETEQRTVMEAIHELARAIMKRDVKCTLSESDREQLAAEISGSLSVPRETDPTDGETIETEKKADAAGRIEDAAGTLSEEMRIYNADFCRWREIHFSRWKWVRRAELCLLGTLGLFLVATLAMEPLGRVFPMVERQMEDVPGSVLQDVRTCLDEARSKRRIIECRIHVGPKG